MGARRSTGLSVVVCAMLGGAASYGCSSTTAPSASGNQNSIVTPDAGSTGEDSGAGDAKAPACSSLRGAYVVEGSCSDPAYSLPSYVCVQQTGCDVSMGTPDGFVLTGTVTDSTYSVNQVMSGLTETCTGSPTKGGLSIACSVPSLLTCDGSATTLTPDEPATETCCDTVAQDCSDANAKCTIVAAANGQAFVPACLSITGHVGEGGSCTRTSLGHDPCEKGLFCSFNGHLVDDRHCLKLCRKDADCGSNAACLSTVGVHMGGMCLPSCAPLTTTDAGGGGGGCAAGLTCRALRSQGAKPRSDNGVNRGTFCDAIGAVGLGGACAASNECGPNAMCWDGVCAAICDEAHSCSAGATCRTFTSQGDTLGAGVPTSLGVCQ